jgi:hypothetical protein
MESDLRSGPGSARYARTPEALKHVRQPIQNLTKATAERTQKRSGPLGARFTKNSDTVSPLDRSPAWYLFVILKPITILLADGGACGPDSGVEVRVMRWMEKQRRRDFPAPRFWTPESWLIICTRI